MGLQDVIGGEVCWHFEFDKHASKILKTHHPDIPNYGDITATDWDIERVDWLTAGYPCQPFSNAGQRKGISDARHIWPYIADGIRVLRPRNILLENVAGHLSLGFGAVLGDLAEIGYDARWLCIRAADAGAPHTRKRIFIVANAKHDGFYETAQRRGSSASENQRRMLQPERRSPSIVANTDCDRSQTGDGEGRCPSSKGSGRTWQGFGPYSVAIQRWERIIGRQAPNPVDEDGRIMSSFVEWMMGLPEGHVTATGLPWTAQIKALGNGVVPQQAALALRLMGVS